MKTYEPIALGLGVGSVAWGISLETDGSHFILCTKDGFRVTFDDEVKCKTVCDLLNELASKAAPQFPLPQSPWTPVTEPYGDSGAKIMPCSTVGSTVIP